MIQLRDYQLRAIEAARASVESGKNAPLIVIPTGGGKTLTASEIVRNHVGYGGNVLWLAHRRELLGQAARALKSRGLRVGSIMGLAEARIDPSAPVQVCSVQTLVSRRVTPAATMVVFDECFAGDTPVSGRRIDSISVGDMVDAYDHATGALTTRRVTGVFKRRPTRVVTVVLSNGGRFVCTPNHPVWVQGAGYVRAGDLTPGTELHYLQENVPCVQHDIRNQGQTANVLREWLPLQTVFGDRGKYESQVRVEAHEGQQSNGATGGCRQDENNSGQDWPPTSGAWGQWKGTNSPADFAVERAGDGLDRRVHSAHRAAWERNSDSLQDRYRQSATESGNRSGRCVPRLVSETGAGPTKGRILRGVRVDRVEVHEQSSDGTFGGLCADGYVYNLEVDGTHNYFANGVLVHNCHHLASDEWSTLANSYRDSIRIGLTATPERADGRALGDVFDDIIVATTVKELTELGHLCPLEIVAPGRILPPGNIAQRPVDAYLEYSEGRPTIVFAPHIKAANKFVDEFRTAGVPVALVTGSMAAGQRARALNEHANGTVLVNVGICTEGYDNPATAVCILARGCGSVSLYIQIVGRVLRPYQGKQHATLIDLRGMVHAHGRPDEDREYSLDGKGIVQKDAPVPGSFCGTCGALLEDESTRCADCGAPRPVQQLPDVTRERLVKYERLRKDDDAMRVERLARWLRETRGKVTKEGKPYKLWSARHKYAAVYGSEPPTHIWKAANDILKGVG